MIVTKRTLDLSGFGGGYEDQMQRMLWRGVAYLAEAKPPVEMWEHANQYAAIIGVLVIEGDQLKALESAIMAPSEDVTGAMLQAVMHHLASIHQHGVDAWLAEAEPDRIYEWGGDLSPQVPV